jgi:uncharacterized membrane protein YuzA (DUF378 family)
MVYIHRPKKGGVFMLQKACTVCKVVGVFAIIGALNWGSIGILGVNFVENILGQSTLTRAVYIVVGLSGLALLASFFMVCPKCKK